MVALSLLTAIASCGHDAERLVDRSTAALLVPDDAKFLDQWHFTVEEAPNNYTARAHWDPAFNPEIDRTLSIESYQINSPADWTGNTPAEDDATRDALVAVLADSNTTTADGPCMTVLAEPSVQLCVYDVDRPDRLPVLIRRFESPPDETVMLVLGNQDANLDYISGSFSRFDPGSATSWRQD